MRTYSVVAVVAATVGILLVVGGAAAATHYIITSTHQIKPSVLSQLRGHQGARGFTGPRGPLGPQGAQGSGGVVPQLKDVDSETLTLQPGQDTFQVDPNNFQANCPPGTRFSGPPQCGIGTRKLVQSFAFVPSAGLIHNDTAFAIQCIRRRSAAFAPRTGPLTSSPSPYHLLAQGREARR